LNYAWFRADPQPGSVQACFHYRIQTASPMRKAMAVRFKNSIQEVWKMHQYALRISVFLVAAAGLFAQTVTPPTQRTRTTGVVGIAEGQIARFDVLNDDSGPTPTAVACTAVLTYYGGDGTLLKSSAVTVAPGQTGSLDLFADADLSLAATQRRQIRATVTVPPIPPPTATSTSAAAIAAPEAVCKLVGTLGIFNVLSGQTQVVLGGMHEVRNEAVVTPATPATSNQPYRRGQATRASPAWPAI
jgi:hypothetical protein